jgi:hypothetical protein
MAFLSGVRCSYRCHHKLRLNAEGEKHHPNHAEVPRKISYRCHHKLCLNAEGEKHHPNHAEVPRKITTDRDIFVASETIGGILAVHGARLSTEIHTRGCH